MNQRLHRCPLPLPGLTLVERQRIVEKLQGELKVLRGTTIGILGLAFKKGVDARNFWNAGVAGKAGVRYVGVGCGAGV